MQITKTIKCPLCCGGGKIFFRPSAKAIPLENGLFICIECNGKGKIKTTETVEEVRYKALN